MLVTKDVSFKWPLQNLRKWLVAQVQKRPISVRLNCAPTAEELAAAHYDVVIAAIGAQPKRPPIPGADNANVMTAIDAYGHVDRLGERIVIIGGGEIGVETGIWLSRLGKQVTVLEMRDKLAADSTPVHYWKMLRDEWNACGNFYGIVSAAVTAITDDGVTYTDKDGTACLAEADTVLLAAGMQPLTAQAAAYYESGGDFYMIGDCQKVGSIQTVMRSAFINASQF